MLSEWELWACAHDYIGQHGFDAPIHAALRADKLLEAGDIDGSANWRAIIHRINELLAKPAGALN
jgi:hypothetical protein